MDYASQSLTNCATLAEALRIFGVELTQEGCIGARILNPTPSKPGYRVQAFHEDLGDRPVYPDGWMRVAMTASVLNSLVLAETTVRP